MKNEKNKNKERKKKKEGEKEKKLVTGEPVSLYKLGCAQLETSYCSFPCAKIMGMHHHNIILKRK